MNGDDFAQVPDLDSQLLLHPSSSASDLQALERNLYKNNDMNSHLFAQYNQSAYMQQEVDPSLHHSLPHQQHFMQGVPDITSGIFTHSGSGQHGGMFAPVHQGVGAGAPPAGPQGDKPTAAQAAAGRLQRASARQASKAAQQQKRQAQARAAAKGGSTGAPVGNAAKRKLKEEEELADEDDEDDSDDDDDDDSDGDDATVPNGDSKHPKPHEVAKTKYNHIEDEKERKRLKRLLRNRVSAQQARERKKAYMSTLEDDRRDIQTRMSEMESKINTLERENFMLRQVVKNAAQGKDRGVVHDEPRAVPTY